MRVGFGPYAHFMPSSQDGAQLRFKLIFKCQRVHMSSSRERQLKTTHVKYECVSSALVLCPDPALERGRVW